MQLGTNTLPLWTLPYFYRWVATTPWPQTLLTVVTWKRPNNKSRAMQTESLGPGHKKLQEKSSFQLQPPRNKYTNLSKLVAGRSGCNETHRKHYHLSMITLIENQNKHSTHNHSLCIASISFTGDCKHLPRHGFTGTYRRTTTNAKQSSWDRYTVSLKLLWIWQATGIANSNSDSLWSTTKEYWRPKQTVILRPGRKS